MYRTNTAGNSFQKVLPNTANPYPVEFIESIVVSKSNPSIVYVAQHRWGSSFPGEIYKSVNGGGTWELLSTNGIPTDLNIVKLLVHPADANVVYGLTGRSRIRCSAEHLYRSVDGGINWNRIGAGIGDALDMDVHPTDTGTVFMSTFESNGTIRTPTLISSSLRWVSD